jgi:hypothetical protein
VIYGNVVNNGTLATSYTHLSSQGTISGSGNYSNNIYNDGPHILLSDTRITGTLVLNDTLYLNGYALNLSNPISGTTSKLIAGTNSSFIISGGFSIPSSITQVNNLTIDYSGGLTLQNDLTVNGILTITQGLISLGGYSLIYGSNSTLQYNSSSDQTTSNVEFPPINGPRNLRINKPDNLNLHASRKIDGTVEILSGRLVAISDTLVLGSTATLAEIGGSVIGNVIVNREVNLSSNEAFGGIGLDIIAIGASPGSTTITRTTGSALTSNNVESIKRYFAIMPTVNEGLDATMKFHYRPDELNLIAEHYLRLYQATSSAGPWKSYFGTVDTTSHNINKTGINSFSIWTAANREFGDTLAPLIPSNLSAIPGNKQVTLQWSQNVEPDFLRYCIYKSLSPDTAELIDSTRGGVADTSRVIDGLENGVKYYFSVTAVDSTLNESDYSNQVSATPFAVISAGYSASDIAFGKVRLGRVKDTLVTITNTGEDTLKVTNIFRTDVQFSVAESVFVIPPSQSAIDTVRFNPTKGGPQSGFIIVENNSPFSPDTIRVSGFGAFYSLNISSRKIVFGNIPIGQFKDTSITITNTGNDTLWITKLESKDSIFSSKLQATTIPIESSIEDTIRFTPTVTGSYSGSIVLLSEADSSPDTILLEGNGVPLTSVDKMKTNVPRMLTLSQNYPNPFNPKTTIDFTLAEDGRVLLKVYNILGKEVATLVDADLKAGVLHQTTFDASDLSSGIYIYRLQTGGKSLLKKFMLLK